MELAIFLFFLIYFIDLNGLTQGLDLKPNIAKNKFQKTEKINKIINDAISRSSSMIYNNYGN